MKYALTLDVETTGLDPKAGARCIEVAVVLVDLRFGEIVASHATLLPSSEGNACEAINHIPAELVRDMVPMQVMAGEPDPPAYGCGDWRWEPVTTLVRQADVIVAHRAAFDYQFVPNGIARLVPWACSKFGIDWKQPPFKHGGSLVELALAHGLPVVGAHRALDDALLLARVIAPYFRYDDPSFLERAIEIGIEEPVRCCEPGCGSWTFARAPKNAPPYYTHSCPRHGGPKSWDLPSGSEASSLEPGASSSGASSSGVSSP